VKVLLAFAATLVVVSASAAATARPAAAPPTIKRGRLVVGLDPPVVGFAVGTLRGQKVLNPHGFEIDLAKAIAAKLRLRRIDYVKVPFAVLFRPGSKPFDLAFEEATITPARSRTVSFSAPYFDANQGVLVSKKIAAAHKVPKSLSDLKKLQLCVQATTTSLDYVQHQLHPQKRPLIYQTLAAGFTAVQIGRCDAFMTDAPIEALQKKTKPSAYGPLAGQVATHEQYGAILTKGSKLKPAIDRAIRSLKANGTIGRLQKRWFSLDFSKLRTLR
jgi:polar amino acid transport system substrate-binding protein